MSSISLLSPRVPSSLICACLTIACGSPDETPAATVFRDSAGIQIVENGSRTPACILDDRAELDIGRVQGPEPYEFQAIGDAATLDDGRIAVLDVAVSEVRLFQPDGTFDIAFGSEGGGPGEFRSAGSLWVLRSDTLLVSDERPLRLSFFTSSGAFVRSLRFSPPYARPPVEVGPLEGPSYLVADECCHMYGDPWEWAERRLIVSLHSADGSLLDTLLTLPYGRWALFDVELSVAGYPIFEAFSHVFASGDRVIVGRGVVRELEVYDVADVERPDMLIRWTGPDRTVRREDIAAYRTWELDRPGRHGLEADVWYRRSAEVLASEDRLVAEEFPAHGDLRIGRDGTFWIQDYPRRRQSPQAWLSFEPSGALLCRLEVPFLDSWDVYEFGPDYVMGRMTDALDVEHVRRYRFSGPGGRR